MYPKVMGKFVEPQVVTSHFHLRESDVVADFGAGSGHYMKPLADAVGKAGRVYLCEIQKNLVDALGIRAHELHLPNVHPVWCDLEMPNGTKLKEGLLDAGLLSNTHFQITNKSAALAEIARVTRKGGKLFVVDWTDSYCGMGPHPDHIIREDAARALLAQAGFTVEHTFPVGEHHYGLACRKN